MGKGEALWLYVICDSHAGGKRGLLICALDFPPHSRRKSVTWTARHYTTAQSLGCLWPAEGPHSVRDHLYENRYKSSRTLPFSKLPHPASFIHCSPFHLSKAPHHPLCPLPISTLSCRLCFIKDLFHHFHTTTLWSFPRLLKKIAKCTERARGSALRSGAAARSPPGANSSDACVRLDIIVSL